MAVAASEPEIFQIKNETVLDKNGEPITLTPKFRKFIDEARLLPGDSGTFDSDSLDIPWLDLDLAQSGQKFVRKHYFGLAIAHTFILLHGLAFKPLSAVLDITGGFSTPKRACQRYFHTVFHVLTWYNSDLIGKFAKGFKDVSEVRKTHISCAKLCVSKNAKLSDFSEDEKKKEVIERTAQMVNNIFEDDLDFIDMSLYNKLKLSTKPPIYMSQFEKSMTQMAFMFPITLFPEAYGVTDLTDIQGFYHLWALLGHLMGIRDEFNWGLNTDVQDFKTFTNYVFLPCYRDMDKLCVNLQFNFEDALHETFKFTSYRSSLYFVFSGWFPEFKGERLWACMAWKDVFDYYLLRLLVFLYRRIIFLRPIMNWFTRVLVNILLSRVPPKDPHDAGMYIPEDDHENDAEWSEKYRKRDPTILKRWHGAETKVKSVLQLQEGAKSK